MLQRPLRLVPFLLLFALVLTACQNTGPSGPRDDDPRALEGVITGALTDSGGAPVAGAQVTLGGGAIAPAALELRPAAADLTVTDADGRFAFDVPEAGEYTLTTLSDTEGAFMRVTVTRGADGKLTSTPISLQSAPLGGVAGRIAGHGAGAWAFLLGTSFLATTDAEGAFVISRVPAGTYQLAPGLLGATGEPVTVTVEAGKVTTVTTPLALGPVITSVEPAGFVPYIYDLDTERPVPDQIRIKGSGFGSSPGISQLRYAGQELSDYVLSWTDDEIVVDLRHNWGTGNRRVVTEDELRFSFANATGEAYSDIGGVVNGYIDSVGWNCANEHTDGAWVTLRNYVLNFPVRNAEIALSVTNGTAHEAPGQPAVALVTTNAYGCAQTYIEPQAAPLLPTIVGASYQGSAFTPEVVGNHALIELDASELELEPGEITIRGQLLHATTEEPMGDDGNYTAAFGYGCAPADEGLIPLNLDDQGRFQIAADLLEEGCYSLNAFYRGHWLTMHTFWVSAPQ